MTWLAELWRRLFCLCHRGRLNRELEEEMEFHLDMKSQQNREAGMSDPEAQCAARQQFGNATLLIERSREMWGWVSLERLGQDLRYGCRVLKNNPGFSVVAILTAALGIGANTSIFSIVDAVLLHPLPYPGAGQLVCPINVAKDNFMGLGAGDFQYAAWRDQAGIFDGIAAYTGRQVTVTCIGEPAERLSAQVVTPGFLRAMGVAPAIGRDFIADDAAPRGGRVVLLHHPLWVRRFGGDASVLSKSITLDGKPYSIAGVLPRDFEFPENKDVSLLIAMTEPPAQPGGVTWFYNVIARIKRDVTRDRAEADLALINKHLESAYPEKFGRRRAGAQTRVVGLRDKLVGNVQPALLALSGAVALVLLLVCVNISNLLLARAIARQKEIAVRVALGAGHGRVVRQLLTEGILLAGAGGLAGLGLAFWGVKLLRAIAPAGVPHIQDAHIGGAVLAFNAVIATLVGVLFGLAPLRSVFTTGPEAALKRTAKYATGSRQHRRVEDLLIVSEIALALILLAGAGLLIRTFAGLTAIAPGFRPDNVLTARLALPYWKYPTPERQRAFLDALLERLRSGPGVEAASAVSCLPHRGFVLTGALQIEGAPTAGEADGVAVNYVPGDYFRAMGIPILEGRVIDRSDRAGRTPVAVINQALARRFFSGVRPLGARIRIGGVTDWLEIVGVVGNVKQGGLASEPRAEIFQSAAQSESGGSAQTLAIRSTSDSSTLIPWLRSQITDLDSDLPPPEIETMRALVASLIASQVFVMRLLALFAGIAVTLAAVGIYGVLVYSVERRSHEIGIRMALGAKRADIMGLILGRGLRLSLAGAAIGVAGGLALTRYLKSLLYGVTPHDPATLVAGCALLVIVSLGAAYAPARRAVKQDAIATLRAE